MMGTLTKGYSTTYTTGSEQLVSCSTTLYKAISVLRAWLGLKAAASAQLLAAQLRQICGRGRP